MFVGVVSPQETEFVISNHEIHEGMCVNFAISTGLGDEVCWFFFGRHLAVNLLHILNTLDLEGVVIGRRDRVW